MKKILQIPTIGLGILLVWLLSSTTLQAQTVLVTSPNGGESWLGGSTHAITWTYSNVDNIALEFSKDNGLTWATLSSSIPSSALSYTWTVPAAGSNLCKIRIKSLTQNSQDDSNATFTIQEPTVALSYPIGGESFAAGTGQYIEWSTTGLTTVMVQYSTDNAATWNDIGTFPAGNNYCNWVAPSTVNTQTKIRVYNIENPINQATSPAAFSIGAVPTSAPEKYYGGINDGYKMASSLATTLAVLAPNGGESYYPTNTVNISWSFRNVDAVKIEYSTNNGSSWNVIAASVVADLQSYSWTLPNIPSGQCLVKVSDLGSTLSDVSNSPFAINSASVAITYPNGGERFDEGTGQYFEWTSSSVATVLLEYSIDNGSTWTSIGTAAAANNYANWVAPAGVNSQCLIRISDNSTPSVSDTSDASFATTSVPVADVAKYKGGSNDGYSMANNSSKNITIISPNGGESWAGYSTHTISWTSTNVDNVSIEFSLDDGISWITLASSLPASQLSFSWTMPGTPSNTCRFRVKDLVSTVTDTNDTAFIIPNDMWVQIKYPNGGESFGGGTGQYIEWDYNNIQTVKLEYSIDNGTNWLAIGTAPAANKYTNWVAPLESWNQVLVRASDEKNSAFTDRSDSVFTTSVTPASAPEKYFGGSNDGYSMFSAIVIPSTISVPIISGSSVAMICKVIGAKASFSVGAVAANTTYQWYSQSATTASTGAWTLLGTSANYSGTTTPSLMITKTTTTVPATGTKYKVVLKSSGAIISSNIVSITDLTDLSKAAVISAKSATNTSLSPANTVCEGGIVNLTLAAGSVGNIQWQSSTDGINFANVGSLVAQTALSATNGAIAYTTGTLMQDTWFRVVASNGECNAVTGTAIKINVNSAVIPGSIIGGDVTVSTAVSSGLDANGNTLKSPITNSTGLYLSGFSGVSLLWQKSTNYVNTSNAAAVWTSAGSTTAVYAASALTANSWYRVQVSNGSCVGYTEPVKITVLPAAKAGVISSAATVSAGSSISFVSTAYSGSSIQWEVSTTSSTTGFKAIEGASGLTYTIDAVPYAPNSKFYVRTVVRSGNFTLSRSAVKTITLNAFAAAPVVSATQSFCASQVQTVASLSATGTAIKWYAAANGGSPLVSSTALATGTYYVTQTIGIYESARMAVAVGINNTQIKASVSVVCSGTAVSLSVNLQNGLLGYSYLWSTGETTAAINPNPTETTTYWCDVTSNGVTCRKEMTITVTPKTIPTFVALAPVCSGTVIAALPSTSTNVITGSWSPALNNLVTTEYTFIPNEGQCAANAKQTIDIINIPAPTATASQTFCTASTIANLVASGTAIKWYASVNGGSPLVSSTALATGTYYASQTIGTCESVRTAVTVSINDAQIKASANVVCSGTTVNLTANSSVIFDSTSKLIDEFSLSFTGPSSHKLSSLPIGDYNIEVNGTFCWGSCWLGNVIDAAYDFNGGTSPFQGAFSINEYCPQDTYGCQYPRPVPDTYNPSHVYNYPYHSQGNDLTIYGLADECCWWDNIAGLNFKLYKKETNVQIKWSTGETTAIINPSPTETTTYWCDVTLNGVTCRKEMTITVTPKTTPTFTQVAAVCSGATIAALPSTSTNGVTGTWSPALNNLATTEYTFTPNEGQCAANARLTIDIINIPAPTAMASQTFCTASTIANLAASGTAIKWYASANEGTALESTSVLLTGTYYASQTIGTCESARTAVAVSINDAQISASATAVCLGQSLNISITGLSDLYGALPNYSGPYYFNSHTYFKSLDSVTWPQAVQNSIDNGGHLFIPNSIDENNFIIQNVYNNVAPPISWIGITDAQNEGVWLDVLGNQVSFTNWRAGEPNNSNNEDYGMMYSDGTWNDFYNYGTWPYVIEFDVNSTLLWSTGETTSTINPSPTETTTYWCDVTTNGVTCRKEMTITVTPKTTPTFTQVAAVCSGATIAALPSTSTNGATGTWSPAVNNLATTEYTFTPTQGQCAANVKQTITVINPPAPKLVSQMICKAIGATATLTVGAAAENTTYQWYSQATTTPSTGAWTLLGTTANYSGATTPTLNLTRTSTTVPATGTKYKVIVTNSCGIATSNSVSITDLTVLSKAAVISAKSATNTILSPANTSCQGSSVNLTLAAGSIGNIQWQSSTDGVNFANVGSLVAQTALSATNEAIAFATGALTQDSWFRVVASNGGCSSETGSAIKITVSNALSGTISAANATVCFGTGTTLSLAGSLGTIQWQKSTNWTASSPTWTALSTSTSATLATGSLTAASAYRVVVSLGTCSTTISDMVTVQINSTPLAKTIVANLTTPSGATSALALCRGDIKTLTIGQGSIGDIQWQQSTSSTTTGFVDIAGASSSSYTIQNPAEGVNYYRGKFTNSCGVIVYGAAYPVYFKNCTVARVASTSEIVKSSFDVLAYPNPSSSNFNLDLKTSSLENVGVLVYDMSGKLIEQQKVSCSKLKDLYLGDSYPTGVYNVIVSQGENSKTVRVVKK